MVLSLGLAHGCAMTATNKAASISQELEVFSDLTASLVPSADVMVKLKDKGFTVDKDIAYHPGQQACQFIHVAKPIAPRAMRLEICHKDTSRPQDEQSGSLDPREQWQEYKFRIDGKLDEFFERKKQDWSELKPRLFHKNYEWQKKDERLPGWNFVEYGADPIPGLGLFFVEREPNPQSPPLELAARREYFSLRYHLNSVHVFLGTLMELKNSKQRQAFELVSQAERSGDCSILPDGTFVQWVTPESDLGQRFRDKKFPIRALILGTLELNKFVETAKPDASFSFAGRTAAQLKLPPEAWDILVVEFKNRSDMLPSACR
jgi:hypothetical protein